MNVALLESLAFATNVLWHTENYRNRSEIQFPSIRTFAYIFESFLIVIKPQFPVVLSVIWIPN